MTVAVVALVVARETTHGSFADSALVAQGIKAWLRSGPRWAEMSSEQREAAEMIATKLARIVCGNPDHPDHWDDIAGYADRAGPRP